MSMIDILHELEERGVIQQCGSDDNVYEALQDIGLAEIQPEVHVSEGWSA